MSIRAFPLSGLTKDTEYTYTAYTDSACTSTKKLDDVTFTTLSVVPTLSVSYVSPTTAKLTMSKGWTGLWMYSADGYRSGSCFLGGEDGDDNIAYLTGLTPGATYHLQGLRLRLRLRQLVHRRDWRGRHLQHAVAIDGMRRPVRCGRSHQEREY